MAKGYVRRRDKSARKEAKKLTLEMWQYLRDHPERLVKSQLPKEIWDKIKDMSLNCPLCQVFNSDQTGTHFYEWVPCMGCPLDAAGENCKNLESAYSKWARTWYDPDVKRRTASRIVEIVEGWQI